MVHENHFRKIFVGQIFVSKTKHLVVVFILYFIKIKNGKWFLLSVGNVCQLLIKAEGLDDIDMSRTMSIQKNGTEKFLVLKQWI